LGTGIAGGFPDLGQRHDDLCTDATRRRPPTTLTKSRRAQKAETPASSRGSLGHACPVTDLIAARVHRVTEPYRFRRPAGPAPALGLPTLVSVMRADDRGGQSFDEPTTSPIRESGEGRGQSRRGPARRAASPSIGSPPGSLTRRGAAQRDRAGATERLTRVERTRRDGMSDTEGDGVHSDSPPVVLDGQRAGDQSPSGLVVCPTSIR